MAKLKHFIAIYMYYQDMQYMLYIILYMQYIILYLYLQSINIELYRYYSGEGEFQLLIFKKSLPEILHTSFSLKGFWLYAKALRHTFPAGRKLV